MTEIEMVVGAGYEQVRAAATGELVSGRRLAKQGLGWEDGLSLFWQAGESGLPRLIVTEDEGARDELLAWSATYIEKFIPLTAHCQVLTRAEYDEALPKSRPELKMGAVWLGLIQCEAVLSTEAPTVNDCLKTYSFAVSRGLAVASGAGYRAADHGYKKLVIALKAAQLSRGRSAVLPAWRLLTSEFAESAPRDNYQPELAEALSCLCNEGYLPTGMLRKLAPQLPDVGRVDDLETWSIERRVELFREMVASAGSPRLATDFALGYVLSRVSAGALTHFRLLRRMGHNGDGVLPWYAVTAGLHPDAQSVGLADLAVVNRVALELSRGFSVAALPSADVQVQELAMMLTAHTRKLRGALSGVALVRVQVAPGVVVIADLVADEQVVPKDPEQVRLGLDLDPVGRLKYHLREAQLAAENVRAHEPRKRQRRQ